MKAFYLLLLCFVMNVNLHSEFDVKEYNKYLESHQNMTLQDLLHEYPAGNFLSEAPSDFLKSDYSKQINGYFKLTDFELSLINQNSFMVSERLKYPTFIHAFKDIFQKDLPLFISSDAILHAFHFNFDKILTGIEESELNFLLGNSIYKLQAFMENYSNKTEFDVYNNAVNDLDIYLSISNYLLKKETKLQYPENKQFFDQLVTAIKSEYPADFQLFSSTSRQIDFSQFKIRGHYTLSPELGAYFKTMMWLGRTEIILQNPENTASSLHKPKDLQRMAILSALITETLYKSGAASSITKMDNLLTGLLGKQDNIHFTEIKNILDSLNFKSMDLTDTLKCKLFIDQLQKLSSAQQSYNSQLLYSDPMDPKQLKLPTVFLLLGQRPILDGFITKNVVFDKIMYEGNKVVRLIPSSLDVLFSIGNDASIQLMTKELEKYPYSSNLASLRYLLDSYDDNFWKSNFYNGWLSAIKSLNPPKDRSNLPKFMQTAGWWQKNMNTQLASWAELRHDFLLYAKQPYTDELACSYPDVYIEPVPVFFQSVIKAISNLDSVLLHFEYKNYGGIKSFFNKWYKVCGKLDSLAQKELNQIEFNKDDKDFLCSTYNKGGYCSSDPKYMYMGWYIDLYSGISTTDQGAFYNDGANGLESDRFVVADVHTIPTDEGGSMVGWVLHAGTGRINLAVINVPDNKGVSRAFIGPVSSYYEFISNDFKRLTNDDWRKMDGSPAYRPSFTKLYMADKDGNKQTGDIPSLFTIPVSVENELKDKMNDVVFKCHPNPTTNNVIIDMIIPSFYAGSDAELVVYDLEGNLVKRLLLQDLYPNNYSFIWDCTDISNKMVKSGIYVCTLKVGNIVKSEKIVLEK